MKKVAAIVGSILVPIVAVFLIPVSDVQGGAALAPAGPLKPTPNLTAEIVTDVTGTGSTCNNAGKGVSSVVARKANQIRSDQFTSSYVGCMVQECDNSSPAALVQWTAIRFLAPGGAPGLISTFIDDPVALESLFGHFGDAGKAAISSIDNVACTTNGTGRKILSFTAVIQYETKSQSTK